MAGIRCQSVRDVQVVVVDSGSTDGTLEFALQHADCVVQISAAEFSFGRALNLGCDASTGALLVIASAHVYPVYDDWVARLIAPLADKQVAVSYGMQRGDWRTRFSEHQIFRQWFPEQSVPQQNTPFCNNANAAIRKEHWVESRYDESLTGLEDLEWAMGQMRLGRHVAYVAEAPVIHVHEETYRRIYNRYRREAIALRRLVPSTHVYWWEFLHALGGNVVADSRTAARQFRLLREISGIVRFRFAQFLGTYHGMHHRGAIGRELTRRFYFPSETPHGHPDLAPGPGFIDYDALLVDHSRRAPNRSHLVADEKA
jgi:glycosyltransferase involved in cell wall biosynthesis